MLFSINILRTSGINDSGAWMVSMFASISVYNRKHLDIVLFSDINFRDRYITTRYFAGLLFLLLAGSNI